MRNAILHPKLTGRYDIAKNETKPAINVPKSSLATKINPAKTNAVRNAILHPKLTGRYDIAKNETKPAINSGKAF